MGYLECLEAYPKHPQKHEEILSQDAGDGDPIISTPLKINGWVP